MTVPADRRVADRLNVLGELHGDVMVVQPMTIREISPNGALVETSMPLHVDALHELRLTLDTHPVVVRGRVVHCSIVDVDQEHVVYRAGLEFVEISDRIRGAIERFIRATTQARARGDGVSVNEAVDSRDG